MADAPIGAQSGARGRHRPHQLVGMQASLHQELALAGFDELDGLGSRRIAVRNIDNLVLADIDTTLARHCRDLCGRPNQDRLDDAEFRCLDRPA